jgi:hypothetical protein
LEMPVFCNVSPWSVVNIYQTWRHIPEDNLHSHRRENPKSNTWLWLYFPYWKNVWSNYTDLNVTFILRHVVTVSQTNLRAMIGLHVTHDWYGPKPIHTGRKRVHNLIGIR